MHTPRKATIFLYSRKLFSPRTKKPTSLIEKIGFFVRRLINNPLERTHRPLTDFFGLVSVALKDPFGLPPWLPCVACAVAFGKGTPREHRVLRSPSSGNQRPPQGTHGAEGGLGPRERSDRRARCPRLAGARYRAFRRCRPFGSFLGELGEYLDVQSWQLFGSRKQFLGANPKSTHPTHPKQKNGSRLRFYYHPWCCYFVLNAFFRLKSVHPSLTQHSPKAPIPLYYYYF